MTTEAGTIMFPQGRGCSLSPWRRCASCRGKADEWFWWCFLENVGLPGEGFGNRDRQAKRDSPSEISGFCLWGWLWIFKGYFIHGWRRHWCVGGLRGKAGGRGHVYCWLPETGFGNQDFDWMYGRRKAVNISSP